MREDDFKTIHTGLSYILSPTVVIDRRSYVQFLESLLQQSIEVTRSEWNSQRIVAVQDSPRVEITVAIPGPSVCQLLVVLPSPTNGVDWLQRFAEAAISAFESTWQARWQVVHCDATIRDLHAASDEHAFKELWERRLRQPPESLNILGRPVLGGGLRLVMPPQQGEADPVQIEVKIESFLEDVQQFFIESQFVWPQPRMESPAWEVPARCRFMSDYIQNSVIPFAAGAMPT